MNLNQDQKALLRLRVADARDNLTNVLNEAMALGLKVGIGIVFSPEDDPTAQKTVSIGIRMLSPVELSFQALKGTEQ
jgi:hypothetical protein